MADQKITELDTLTPVDNSDWVPVVDVSDTTDGPDGTTKKALRSEFMGEQGEPGPEGPEGPAGSNGANGADGESAFVYIAYASDGSGTGFTLTFNASLDYIAILATNTEIVSPVVGDFAGLWKNYKGATGATGPTGPTGPAGAGSGDMLAATYDPQNIADDAFDTDNHTSGMTNKVYTATEKTKLSGIETAADVTDAGNVGSSIHGATGKTTPVDADTMPVIDSAASNVLKKVTWANIKATLKAYFDTLYEAAGAIATHAAVTATHGATGAVVGTTNTQTLTNKTLTSPVLTTPSGFITGGAITLAENTSIALDPAGSADGKYTGITVAGTAGYTQAFGDLNYLDPTDSRWELADANSAAAADGDARGILGMVVVAGTDGNACTILLLGIIRADAKFPSFTVNNPIYVSETAGSVTQTQPTTTDVVIRVVGQALTADEMYFNPSPDHITHT